jgi:hypothetical protein
MVEPAGEHFAVIGQDLLRRTSGNPPTMSICHNSIGARLRYAATLAETA